MKKLKCVPNMQLSNNNLSKIILFQPLILSQITSRLPEIEFDKLEQLSHINYQLADPCYFIPKPIDILLGADVLSQIIVPNSKIQIIDRITILNTMFGLVLFGNIQYSKGNCSSSKQVNIVSSDKNLEPLLQKFWELEEVSREGPDNPLDNIVERHFERSHCRTNSGRYMVSLPVKNPDVMLRNDASRIKRQFLSLEKRLSKKPEHLKMYYDFLQEYLTLGHMSPAPFPASYVIPHHVVFKATSSTTKLRVVFNASDKSINGLSLNDNLYKGPKLQQELEQILVSFRLKKIALCCDIKQMYRQVLINPQDRHLQHIICKISPEAPITEYQLNTITYGLTPSSYQAQRVLFQLVEDEGTSYPLASKAIKYHTYMDDIVTGSQNIEEGIQLRKELIMLLKSGGFELRKWVTNDKQLWSIIPEAERETTMSFDLEKEETSIKVLGLNWIAHSDVFSFAVNQLSAPVTKRGVLSFIARIFDPHGFVSPSIFWAKYFMQSLWRRKLDWDHRLPDDLVSIWLEFTKQIPAFSKLRIPRYIMEENISEISLIGFSDASEMGYAAVAYLRYKIPTGYKVSLLKSKTKVAPTKVITIPKLELCGALLLTKLIKSLKIPLSSLNISAIYLFSDSTVVLSWLKTPAYKLKIFVANRIIKITEDLPTAQWLHINSQDNIADLACRGAYPQDLVSHDEWWNGPKFLSYPKSSWPETTINISSELPELKTDDIVLPKKTLLSQINNDHPIIQLIERVSSFNKLQAVVAYILRFLAKYFPKACLKCLPASTQSGPLTVTELDSATLVCVKITQEHYLTNELNLVENNKSLPPHLKSLCPYIDPFGVLRVGGRLAYAPLPHKTKHPVLLPKKGVLVNLIVDSYHKITKHGGPTIVQALVQQSYWILSCRNLVRQRIHQCLPCYRLKAKPMQPLMSDIPPFRYQQIRAFLNVGMDYAGPFIVRESLKRKATQFKAYLVVFICMSTRAIHLELVTSLTTEAFLSTLDRFVSRRGLPQNLYSDQGTNFVGAASQFRQLYEFFHRHNKDLSHILAKKRINFYFNPPSAPSFGGGWEAGVKSVKHHLSRVMQSQIYTFEELYTLLCRVEAVLNSRPLCSLSSDPSEAISFLSPGHFLIGGPLVNPVETDLSEIPDNRLSRWELIKKMSQHFWSRWSREYLQTLIKRQKWYQSIPALQVGDVVFLAEDSQSPLEWPLARVLELKPGKDGIVRVCSIKTHKSILIRPVNKLVPLPKM